MKTQKKSLLNNLNTTKKAIVASNSAEKPNVAAPIAARFRARIIAKATSRVFGRLRQY